MYVRKQQWEQNWQHISLLITNICEIKEETFISEGNFLMLRLTLWLCVFLLDGQVQLTLSFALSLFLCLLLSCFNRLFPVVFPVSVWLGVAEAKSSRCSHLLLTASTYVWESSGGTLCFTLYVCVFLCVFYRYIACLTRQIFTFLIYL